MDLFPSAGSSRCHSLSVFRRTIKMTLPLAPPHVLQFRELPFLTYAISPSIAGIAFNPVTRQAVLADPNATSSQITFIDPQSESVRSMSVFSEETGPVEYRISGASARADVAFQPFSNTVVYFQSQDQRSLAAGILPSCSVPPSSPLVKPGLLPSARANCGFHHAQRMCPFPEPLP